MSVLMIFVDGFGIGDDNPDVNPLARARTTHLRAACGKVEGPALRAGALVVSTDATLNVGGLPQSATGQTTLLTGINAARKVGRHVHGFCTRALAGILDGASLFARVREGGGRATFANAYTPEFFRGERRFLSVTTVAAKQTGLPLRDLADLARGEAVFHDITNRSLRTRGYGLPEVSPQEAGRRMARLARSHDFTLYEHFQTDQAGHERDMDRGVELLERLDLLVDAVLEATDRDDTLVVVASDHG
ncbi:MAG TPA: peptidase, partial [Candidatus Methylomirabilis sp.]|nr:peptidase [Candidatus Methylomirabilis sp.]